MITAVDTNVLIDILEGAASATALAHAAQKGALIACEAVWANRLLTRDDDFHRMHFNGLKVETPAAA